MREWLVALLLGATSLGCALGGSGGSSSDVDESAGTEVTTPLPGPRPDLSMIELLNAWDESAGEVVDALAAVGEDAAWLEEAFLLGDDDTSVDIYADLFALDVDALLAATEALDELEDELLRRQGTSGPRVGVARAPLIGIIGAAVTIYGLYTFGKVMKAKSDRLTKQRQRRDAALEGIAQGVDGAQEDYQQAKDEMQTTGEEAVEEFATKVTTELVLSPANPKTVIGILVKHKAGNAVQKGLKVLAGTRECGQAGTSDSMAPGCRISAARTDDAGKVTAPAGTVNVAISGGGNARTVRGEVEAEEDAEVTIEVIPVPVEGATPEAIKAADNGETVAPNPTDPPDAGPMVDTTQDVTDPPDPGSVTTTPVSGTFPSSPHAGLTLTYEIDGVELSQPVDSVSPDGLEMRRKYQILAHGGPVRVSGMCEWDGEPGAPNLGGKAVVLWDDTTEQKTGQGEPSGPWSWNYDITADVPAAAKDIQLLILCDYGYFVGSSNVVRVEASNF